MEIYVTHSRSFDYKNHLYFPIRRSHINQEHKIILPHEESDEPFNSKSIITGGSLSLLVAEVSFKSTAQGVELGWADISKVPIALFYRPDSNPSNALRKVSSLFVPYSNDRELIEGMESVIRQIS
ncbi:MAG: hypothetical protein WC867_07650 [Candidatus Pacearchaeota archaeon]